MSLAPGEAAAEDPQWHARADSVEARLRTGELSVHDAESEVRRLLDDQNIPEEGRP